MNRNRDGSNEDVGNGWRNYEFLGQEVSVFDSALDRYDITVQRERHDLWEATLVLPDHRPMIIDEDQLLAAIRDPFRKHRFRVDVHDGRTDAFYVGLPGHYVQDIIEMLALNVSADWRFTYSTTFTGPGGCICSGMADASILDSLGYYLLHGSLYGYKDGDQVVIHADHKVLPPYKSAKPHFREAYHDIVGQIKAKHTEAELYEATESCGGV